MYTKAGSFFLIFSMLSVISLALGFSAAAATGFFWREKRKHERGMELGSVYPERGNTSAGGWGLGSSFFGSSFFGSSFLGISTFLGGYSTFFGSSTFLGASAGLAGAGVGVGAGVAETEEATGLGAMAAPLRAAKKRVRTGNRQKRANKTTLPPQTTPVVWYFFTNSWSS